MNFNEIFGVLNMGSGKKKENDCWNTNKQLTPSTQAPQVDAGYFGVHVLTINYKL